MHQFAVETDHKAIKTIAKAHGASDNRIENRLDVGWRAGNDAKNFTRLCQLSISCLHLLKEPDIVDGDDSLAGEGSHELDLLVTEGAGTSVRERDKTPIGTPS